jgi:hypothetical protein
LAAEQVNKFFDWGVNLFGEIKKQQAMENFKKKLAGVMIVLVLLANTPVGFVLAQNSDSASSTPAAIVDTGDAAAVTEVENAVNTNLVETAGASPAIITVSAENEATTTTDVLAEAVTGDNRASGNQAGVNTGNAVAVVNLTNVVNTNIFDSQGFILLLNSLFGDTGTIDTRKFIGGGAAAADCGENCSLFTATKINATSTAKIANNIVVRADSGGNAAKGEKASITTGDAFAGVNLINLANTNIIDSNYMVVAFNGFGGWGGDLVLPGKDFWSNFTEGGAGWRSASLSVKNQAAVENQVAVEANTGGNDATGDNSFIQTGRAAAAVNIVNSVNGNFFNQDSLFMVFRVFGNWSGTVFSAPPGITWSEGENGIQIKYDEAAAEEAVGGDCGDCAGALTAEINNNAGIQNNVSVFALTGANKVDGDAAAVRTGDAFAGTNIINLANNNIFGRNWILAVFNIFGDWSGNVAFGRPDLWVGTEIESTPSGVEAGSSVNYKFTVANRGDADATNVILENRFSNRLLSFKPFLAGQTLAPEGPERFYLGNIPAGAVRKFTFTAHVSREAQYGQTNTINIARVYAYEPDQDDGDNIDYARLTIVNNHLVENGAIIDWTPDAALSIKKWNNRPFGIYASSTVGYTVVIENKGGPAYHAVLEDLLKNEEGEEVAFNTWDLGTILPHEEITVNYSTFFNKDTPPGKYTNYARVRAVGRHPSLNPFYGNFADTETVTSVVKVLAPTEELVAAAPESILETPEETLATTTIDRLIYVVTAPAVVQPIAPPTTPKSFADKKLSPFPPLLPQALPPSPPITSQFFDNWDFTVMVGARRPFKLPKDFGLAALLVALIGISLNRFQPVDFRRLRRNLTTFFW